MLRNLSTTSLTLLRTSARTQHWRKWFPWFHDSKTLPSTWMDCQNNNAQSKKTQQTLTQSRPNKITQSYNPSTWFSRTNSRRRLDQHLSRMWCHYAHSFTVFRQRRNSRQRRQTSRRRNTKSTEQCQQSKRTKYYSHFFHSIHLRLVRKQTTRPHYDWRRLVQRTSTSWPQQLLPNIKDAGWKTSLDIIQAIESQSCRHESLPHMVRRLIINTYVSPFILSSFIKNFKLFFCIWPPSFYLVSPFVLSGVKCWTRQPWILRVVSSSPIWTAPVIWSRTARNV